MAENVYCRPLINEGRYGFFSNHDPHPCQVHLEGTSIVLATTSTRVGSVLGPPAPMHTSATSQDVEGITPGTSAPPLLNPTSNHPKGQGNLTASSMVLTTAASSFGGLVTPVNVLNLQSALRNHPKREFVNKLCLELREGARIGYSGPRHFRFSKNLPTVSSNPEVFTSNVAEEVAKGCTAGPFCFPPFENFHVSPIGFVPKKNIQRNFGLYFICPSPNQEIPA